MRRALADGCHRGTHHGGPSAGEAIGALRPTWRHSTDGRLFGIGEASGLPVPWPPERGQSQHTSPASNTGPSTQVRR
jgi:hypothetical protein